MSALRIALGPQPGRRDRRRSRSAQRATRLALESLERRWVLDSTVVFNEIMYHPATNEAALEWVELHNQMAVDMDLSGWSIQRGVDYAFPAGTRVAAGGYLVVALDPAALATAGHPGAIGPFVGRLDNPGDTLRLVNNSQRVMDEVAYQDDGAWPVAPDGSGVSLAKRDPDAASAAGGNWTWSDQLGGTPGAANFAPFDTTPTTSTLAPLVGSWKYNQSNVDLGAAWSAAAYDDSAWPSGGTLFYAGAGTVGAGGTPPASLNTPPIAVANASFEDGPLNAAPGYGSFDNWTATGLAGHNDALGTFNNALTVPDGNRVAFAQQVASVSQSVSGLTLGKRYTLTYFENERGQAANDQAFAYAKYGTTNVVPQHVTARTDRYRRVVSQPFVPATTSAALVLGNARAAGDTTALFDRVRLTRAVPAIANANFEAYALLPAQFQYAPNGAAGVGWTFTGGSGVSRNGSGFQGGDAAADGNQLSMLQTAAGIVQTLSSFEVGVVYSFSWSEMRRTNWGDPNDLAIVLDEGLPTQLVLSPAHLVTNTSFLERTSPAFVAGKTNYTLTLRTTNPLGTDATTFVDDLHFNFVSESVPRGTSLSLVPTVYFRKSFTFAGDPNHAQLHLNGAFDDGAVVYLNGTEIFRHNMPAGPIAFATPASTGVGTPGFTGSIDVPSADLVAGTNVLAIELHQANPNGTDLVFGADLSVTVTPVPPAPPARLAINEIASAGDATFRVELTNPTAAPIDAGGYVLATSTGSGAEFVLPGQIVPPGGLLALDEAQLGFQPLAGDKLFLFAPGKSAVVDAASVSDRLRGRLAPQGNWAYPGAATFGSANQFALHDQVVINEIMYHQRPTLEVPLFETRSTPVPFLSDWKYEASGADLGTAWREPGFPDGTWASGGAALYGGVVQIGPGGGPPPAGLESGPVSIANAGFEEGVLPPWPGYGAIPGWSSPGGSGINDAAGPFVNGAPIPAGNYVGFAQGATNFSQTVTGLAPGKSYTVSYWENDRANTADHSRPYATLGGFAVVPAHTAVKTDRFRRVIGDPFAAFDGTAQLVLGNSQSLGDTSALFDGVSISRAVPRIANGNFEDYVLGPGASQTAPNGAPGVAWQFAGSGGVSRNGSSLQQPALAVDGNQLGFLQGSASLIQTVAGLEPGASYSLVWAEQKVGSATNDLEIVLDAGLPSEIVLSPTHLVTAASFSEQTSVSFVAAKGSYALTLRSHDPGGAAGKTLVDDLRFAFVAEPPVLATELPLGPTTYYFRTQFSLFQPPADTVLQINALFDDGAVVYLNGTEIYRQNLPSGAITAATQAWPVASPTYTGPLVVPAAALVEGTNVLAVEVHQAAVGDTDLAFGLELSAATTSGGTPFAERDEEWIELFNRSAGPVDLSGWRLDETVDFDIPAGTVLPPGGYLVVAQDAASLAARYPGIAIVGDFHNRLANSGGRIVLKDAANNIADEVRYYSTGRWSEYADGGGSSLELRDPWADNSIAESWAASDESGKSTWRTYRYRGLALPETSPAPTLWNELVLGLLDAGEMLLDDVSVVESPGGAAVQLLQNGTFEAGLGAWRIIGNHHGAVELDPANPANHVLHLVASGFTEHMHNHAETTLAGGAAIVNGREYEISFRAKWLGGASQLNTRLYFNRLPRTTLLDVPANTGTPGVANSRLIANAGPTFRQLAHEPLVPAAAQAVSVSVAIDDPQGVAAATLWWSAAGGAWQSAPLAPVEGRYAAQIPGEAAGTVVQFYVQATDGLGAGATFPARGPAAGALYKVADGQAGPSVLHDLRIIMTAANSDLLYASTNVMSNDRLPATVIYDGRTAYYDVGVRLKGSGYGRSGLAAGWDIAFQPEQLFRGVHEIVTIDRGAGPIGGIGASQHELLFKHIALHAGDIPEMYDDVVYVVAPRPEFNGDAQLLLARYEDVFLDSQYADGGDGAVFEQELIYYSTVTVDGNPESLKQPPGYNAVVPLAVDIQDLGPDKESYRWHYLSKNQRTRDDYRRIIDLSRAFSQNGAALDAATQATIDVDQWLRLWAFESLTGVADTYNAGLPHNLELFVRPADDKVLALPWDSDHAFYWASNTPLLGVGQTNLQKVLSLPANTRRFYGHLWDLLNTTFTVQYLTYWAQHYGSRTGQNHAANILAYVGDRRNFVLGQLPAQVPFVISTNGGADFSTDQPSVTIAGDGWIDVHTIRVAGSELPVTWTDLDSWQIAVPLSFGSNALVLEALDRHGNPVGTDSINVTSTSPVPTVLDHLRITEVMYHPAAPPPGSPFVDEDFEYLELANIGVRPLPVGGAVIDGGVRFLLPNETLGPGEHVLVVANRAAFESRYGSSLHVLGEYTGRLSNAGEQLLLFGGLSEVVLNFTYDDVWYPATDGVGPSLVVVNELAPRNTWGLATSWRASTGASGSPGAVDPAISPSPTVTNTLDSGHGSLRQAILDVQATPGQAHTIAFVIPGPAPHVIAPASALPAVGEPVTFGVGAGDAVDIGGGSAFGFPDFAALTKAGAGTLVLGGNDVSVVGAALAVEAGIVRFREAASGLLVLDALTVAPGAGLDLNDSDLVVRATAATRGAVLGQVTALVASGAAGLTWTGPGIRSSAAAADSSLLSALGAMLNDDGFGGPFHATFDGLAATANDVLVKYTYYGDADLSGAVDGTDYALTDNGFNAVLTGWFNGDFDYTALVDGTDYALIDNAFNSQGGPLGGDASLPPLVVEQPPRPARRSPHGSIDDALGDADWHDPLAFRW